MIFFEIKSCWQKKMKRVEKLFKKTWHIHVLWTKYLELAVQLSPPQMHSTRKLKQNNQVMILRGLSEHCWISGGGRGPGSGATVPSAATPGHPAVPATHRARRAKVPKSEHCLMRRKCWGRGEMARKGRFWHLSDVTVGLLCSGKRDYGGVRVLLFDFIWRAAAGS